jgi:phosphoribosylformylglycinamidine synthase
MVIDRFYRKPGLSSAATATKLRQLRQHTPLVNGLETELCFNIETTSAFTDSELKKIQWILGSPLEPESLTTESNLHGVYHGSLLIEIGPR